MNINKLCCEKNFQQKYKIIETHLINGGKRKTFLIRDSLSKLYVIDYDYTKYDLIFYNNMLTSSIITKLKTIILKYIREEKRLNETKI